MIILFGLSTGFLYFDQEFFADFGMEDIKHYIYQMLLGVKTLKSMGIFHRDVKPGNFLFNKKERKGILIDYGLSEIVNMLN